MQTFLVFVLSLIALWELTDVSGIVFRTKSLMAETATIYLPFPDLPREILEPQPNPSPTHSPAEEPYKSSPSIGTLDSKNSVQESAVRMKENGLPVQEKSDPIANTGIKPTVHNSGEISKKNISQKPVLSPSAPKALGKPSNQESASSKIASRPKSNPKRTASLQQQSNPPPGTTIPPDNKPQPSRPARFGQSTEREAGNEQLLRSVMENIRNLEKQDPSKAIAEYKKQLDVFFDTDSRVELFISLAWNYYLRNQNLDCLETLLNILEDREAIHHSDYPTALYLAYKIHMRPWEGRNADHARRYKEVYWANWESGKENFRQNLYHREIH